MAGLRDIGLREHADETAEYQTFAVEDGATFRGGAVLYPTSTATTVHVKGARGGDVVTTDGPYAETKEALTGFYMVEAKDLDAALALAERCPGAWHGTVEVRPRLQMG